MSTVAEMGESNDFSRQTGNFDFHTDGLYQESVPECVLLHCIDPGRGETPTAFADGREALAGLELEVRLVLDKLDLVYIGKDGRHIQRPLVGKHPRTGEAILNLGARAFVQPRRDEPEKSETPPPLRELVRAVQALYEKLDEVAVQHFWRRGDTILFDNNTFVHRRTADKSDGQRRLVRLWLAPPRVNSTPI